MKKISVILIAVIILAVAGYYIFMHNQAKAPVDESFGVKSGIQPNPQQQQVASTSPSGQTPSLNNVGKPDYTPNTSPTGGETPGVDIQVVAVDYNGSLFTPAKVNIKVNDWIFFKNNSTVNFWPKAASDATAAAYPKFNPAGVVAAGGEYKFQFSKAGSWSFGDNLNPGTVFSVTVGK